MTVSIRGKWIDYQLLIAEGHVCHQLPAHAEAEVEAADQAAEALAGGAEVMDLCHGEAGLDRAAVGSGDAAEGPQALQPEAQGQPLSGLKGGEAWKIMQRFKISVLPCNHPSGML